MWFDLLTFVILLNVGILGGSRIQAFRAVGWSRIWKKRIVRAELTVVAVSGYLVVRAGSILTPGKSGRLSSLPGRHGVNDDKEKTNEPTNWSIKKDSFQMDPGDSAMAAVYFSPAFHESSAVIEVKRPTGRESRVAGTARTGCPERARERHAKGSGWCDEGNRMRPYWSVCVPLKFSVRSLLPRLSR